MKVTILDKDWELGPISPEQEQLLFAKAMSVYPDVDPKTMLVDYDALESAITPRTKAIIPVSLFGNPLDYGRLRAIKEKHGVYIVEDAACSIGEV